MRKRESGAASKLRILEHLEDVRHTCVLSSSNIKRQRYDLISVVLALSAITINAMGPPANVWHCEKYSFTAKRPSRGI